MDKGKPLDQILYEAFCEEAGWKSAVTDAPLPQYAQCPDAVKRCWRATADAAMEWAFEREMDEQHAESEGKNETTR